MDCQACNPGLVDQAWLPCWAGHAMLAWSTPRAGSIQDRHKSPDAAEACKMHPEGMPHASRAPVNHEVWGRYGALPHARLPHAA